MLDHGHDGPVFVNVFRAVIPEFGSLEQEERDMLFKCAPSIQTLLDESIHEPKHFDKLNYLAAQWNDNVRDHGPEGLNRVVGPSQRRNLR